MPYDKAQAVQIANFIETHPHVRTGQLADWANEQKIRKYTSRISDARELGYIIDCKRVGARESEYTVVSKPGEQPFTLEVQ